MKRNRLRIQLLAAVGLGMLALAGNGYGQKINWGNAAGDINIDSHGVID